MYYLLLILPAATAGFLQGLTGFGSGIILAIIYPHLMGVAHTAAMNQALALLICARNVFHYRRYVQWRLVLRPAAMYMPLFWAALTAAQHVDASALKPLLGVFLIFLSIYFICFSSRIHLRPTWPTELVCVAVSAVVDAFFGLGGPAMAVYFLAAADGKETYLGTLQGFFLTINIYSVAVRFLSGGFPAALIPVWVIAAAGIMAGTVLAVRVVEKVNIEQIKRFTYIFIGGAGIVTAFI